VNSQSHPTCKNPTLSIPKVHVVQPGLGWNNFRKLLVKQKFKVLIVVAAETASSSGPAVFCGKQIFTPHQEFAVAVEFVACHGKMQNYPFLLHSGFFKLLFNFAIYKTIKSSRCRLWFCALAPLSKLDTR